MYHVMNIGYLIEYVVVVTEDLLKESFVVMKDQENRFSWLDHNHGSSVKFVDADDSEYEVGASHTLYSVQLKCLQLRFFCNL